MVVTLALVRKCSRPIIQAYSHYFVGLLLCLRNAPRLAVEPRRVAYLSEQGPVKRNATQRYAGHSGGSEIYDYL